MADGFPNSKVFDFWQYQNKLTPEQWKQCIGYAYRTSPTVVLGSTSYLFKFVEPVTMDYFKEKHGGGGYKIMFNRSGTTLYVEKFAIEGEPKLTDAEKAGKVPSAAESAAASNNTEVISLLRDTIDRLQGGQDTALVKASLAQALDLQSVGFKSALDAVTSATKNQESGETKMLFTMFTSMMEKMMSTALAPRPEPPDPLAKLDTMFSIMERFRDEAGPRPRNTNAWVAVAEKFVEKVDLDAVLSRLVVISQNVAAARGAAVPPAPTVAGAPALPAPTRSAAAPAATTPVTPTVVQVDAQRETQFKLLVASWLEQGFPGAQAAGALSMLPDAEDFAIALAKTLKENPASLANDPVFSQILNHPRLREFIAGFVSYIDQEFGEDEETVPVIPEAVAETAPAS